MVLRNMYYARATQINVSSAPSVSTLALLHSAPLRTTLRFGIHNTVCCNRPSFSLPGTVRASLPAYICREHGSVLSPPSSYCLCYDTYYWYTCTR